MPSGKYWSKREDEILIRRMDLLKGDFEKRARRILREGLLPGRAVGGAVARYYKLLSKRRDGVAAKSSLSGRRLARLGRMPWSKPEDKILFDAMKDAGSISAASLVRGLVASNALPKRTDEAMCLRIRHLRREAGERMKLGPRAVGEPMLHENISDDSHPDCFGNYCAEDDECNKCDSAEDCGSETPRDYEEDEGHGDLAPVPDDEGEDVGEVLDLPRYAMRRIVVYTMDTEGHPCRKTAIETIGMYVAIPSQSEVEEDFETSEYGDGEYLLVDVQKHKLVKRYTIKLRSPTKSRVLNNDKRPLIKVMLLLDKARDNREAWHRLFPRALKAAEGVYADIDAARKELGKMATLIKTLEVQLEKTAMAVKMVEALHKKKMSEEADNLAAEMEENEAALEREKLVDRELKRRD